ncbi:MAG: hypothetical protein AB2L14_19960 [Candidatus Xenobiia bacterium LiM19]
MKRSAIKVKDLHDGRLLTFRPSGGVRFQVEGEILTVETDKKWAFKKTSYVSGRIVSERLDIKALKLVPLSVWPVPFHRIPLAGSCGRCDSRSHVEPEIVLIHCGPGAAHYHFTGASGSAGCSGRLQWQAAGKRQAM